MRSAMVILTWSAFAIAVAVPIIAAATSPLLAWRDPVYILAGFSGVIGLVFLLCQPLLAAGIMPGLSQLRARHVHRWVGASLVVAVAIHVIGLWITSPPDVIDALLFRSPSVFSDLGVIAMWAVIATAFLVRFRRHMRRRNWQFVHLSLTALIVGASVTHAMLIEGTMELISKAVLCGMVIAATLKVIAHRLKRP